MPPPKVVKKRPPPRDWHKALDDFILKRKRPVKLILLHSCEKGDVFAINPELILEIGNTVEEEEVETPRPEDQIRVLQSRVTSFNEALLYLASRPFQLGDRIKFSGLTRVHQLDGVEATIRATSSNLIAGDQVTLGSGAMELMVHNYSTIFPLMALGAETGYVFERERKLSCGFVSCCGGEKIETRESMEVILGMISKAGVGTVHDPDESISH